MNSMWAWLGSLALALVSGGGGVAWYKTLKDDRRAERSEPVDLVSRTLALQVDQSNHLAQMQQRMSELFEQNLQVSADAAHAKSEAAEALRRAAHAEAETLRMREALHWITAQVSPIIAWVDAGAHPPPPVISPDLRAYLAGELNTLGRRRPDEL